MPGKTMLMLAAVAATSGQAAAAQQQASSDRALCRDLERVVRAAPDFGFLERAHPAPPRFGFRNGCRASAAVGASPASWRCHQQLAPEELGLERLTERLARCMGGAVPAERSVRHSLFILPKLRISVEQIGGPRAKVGRIVTLSFEAGIAAP